MKKCYVFLCLVLTAVLLFTASVSAESNLEGYIYSTDILTFVNGKPIRGYNIGGRTVVIAEDLIGYGFDVKYQDDIRTLSIQSCFYEGSITPDEIKRGQVGEILGNVYKTDIKVYYNGILLKGYNIGGRTAVCLEDLGELTDSPNAVYGYSDYLGKSVWDAENRTICFTSFINNANSIVGISGISLSFRDNVIYATATADSSDIQSDLTMEGYSPGSAMSVYCLKPLYFDDHGEQVEIGCAIKHPVQTEDYALMYIENPQFVIDMIKTYLLF